MVGAFQAFIENVAAGRLPRWVRFSAVTVLAAVLVAAAAITYRAYTERRILTLAAGSLDGDVPKLMAAVAARLSATDAPIRLRIFDRETVANSVRAFAAGEADLVVARSDVGDLSSGQTVAVITHAVVLLLAPSGSPIESIEDLKGKTVSIVGAEANKPFTNALRAEYDLDKLKVQFKDLPLSEVKKAVHSKQVSALLVVMPITAKYTSMLRDFFPRDVNRSFRVIPIELASAIAQSNPAYESYELPKGSLRGSPAVPEDDLTTLRVPFYLVARKELGNEVVAALARSIMEARRALASEHPLLSQISAPDKEKDTFIPIHPGAAAYFDGEEKTIFDRYGDQIFYGSMVLGTLLSLLATAWRFMTKDAEAAKTTALMRLYALREEIYRAASRAELLRTEHSIDKILAEELEKRANDGSDPGETAAFGLATRRLEHLLELRRRELSTED